LRKQFVSKAADSMTQMFEGFSSSADQSQEHLDRLSRMGAAAFDNLRKHGYSVVEALDAMKPAIDAAIEAAKKSGKALTGPMKALADFQRKVEKNRATVDAATAMGDVIAGARAAGSFDQKSAQDAADEIKQLMKDKQKEGFTTSQALALIAPALYQIQQAAAAGQITIDAETQALIDQAQAGGMFDGLVDPMAQLVEIQQAMLELWIEIAKVLGAAVPAAAAKAAAAIGNIPAPPTGTPPPPGGADTGQDAGDGRRNPQRHATGGVARYTGWHILEQGERVLTPAQTRQWDHRGYGYEQGGVAGGGGGVAIHVGGIAIHGSADPKATAEAVAKELERRTAPRLRSAVRRAAAGRS